MCLAIPVRVVELLGESTAVVDLDGIRKEISLALVDGVQVGDAVARDRVGVTAAELHQVVAAARVRLRGDGGGDAPRQLAVAELVDVLHVTVSALGDEAKSASVRSASAGSSLDSA